MYVEMRGSKAGGHVDYAGSNRRCTLSRMDGGSSPESELELELIYNNDGTWRDRWRKQQLFLVVAGPQEAPSPGHVATLRDVMARWAEVQQTVATYVRGLASGEHVPLRQAELGGFAASSCGFDQKLSFDAIRLTDPSAPRRVFVWFYTGYPDGYATYEVRLDDGVATGIRAFAS
jgi:hypothetical protein